MMISAVAATRSTTRSLYALSNGYNAIATTTVLNRTCSPSLVLVLQPSQRLARRSFFAMQQPPSSPKPVSPSPPPSSSSSKEPSRPVVANDLKTMSGIVAELRTLVAAYIKGTRALWTNTKESLRIQKEKRRPKVISSVDSQSCSIFVEPDANSTNKDLKPLMDYRDLRIVHKAKADLLQALPLVTMFAIPIIGNTVPLITYFFPFLLPANFRTESQNVQMSAVIRDMQKESSDIIVRDIKREATVRDILPLHHLFQGPYKTIQALKELTKTFEDHFAVPKLSKEHLRALSDCYPYSATRIRVWPAGLYQRNLNRAAALLFEEDVALLRQNLSSLTLEELQEACQSRAIHVKDNESKGELKDALKDWLSVSQAIYDSIRSNSSKRAVKLPVSFYLHARF